MGRPLPAEVASLLAGHSAALEAWWQGPMREICGLDRAPPRIVEAVEYSLLAGGKRLRPSLVLESARCCGGSVEAALPAAAAVELIHTFSLVHDDLPAMDDDDLRRGRPTSHKQIGEALAILAGDAMTAMAFEVLAATPQDLVPDLIRLLARATGPVGMVGGQALDIDAEHQRLDFDALRDIHRRKTGALITAACEMGAVVAHASGTIRRRLAAYGRHLGLGFQIADDVLDATATVQAAGKRVGKDADAGKNTYTALLGIGEARRLARDESESAVAALADFGSEADGLRALARFAADRDR
jgi:geranylgeranyl pyrophosphate synthase